MNRNHSSSSDPNGWWVPYTDVYTSEDGRLVIEVELAAVNKQDLELTIEANRLSIRGERSDDGRRRRCKYLVQELRYGPFQSAVEIPSGYDLARGRTTYQNGIFRIELPLKTDGSPS